MMIDHVNLNHIRIFECVYRSRSMTGAAKELHLTQSGVSQHVKSLEDMLGVKLFDRINQKLVPTPQAALLYQECNASLNQIEQALWRVKGTDKELSGIVSIGVPIEFGNNLIVPLLAKFSKKNPLVQFKLTHGYASAMNDKLLKGDLDFAFVDEFRMDKRVKTEQVYDETLELCVSEELFKKFGAPKHQKKYFEALEYVEYEDDAPLLRMWFAHHLDTTHLTLNIRTTVMDTQTIARLIVSEMGAGILPGHLVNKLAKEGHKIHRFKGSGKPLKNTISVAYLGDRSHSPATLAVLDSLKEALAKT